MKRLALAAVVIASYLTYVHGYASPAAPFWDENYHIASAQKYLHGIFFMELHPPLGKLLIALGEWLLHPNAVTTGFVSTDYAATFPEGFSFAGYRLMPALCAWLTAPVLFAVFWRVARDGVIAGCLSALYVFDNALIVHSRGAMLEGPLLLSGAISLWLFFAILDAGHTGRRRLWLWAGLGATVALAAATKVLGLILLGLPLGLVVLDRRSAGARLATFFVTGLVVYCAVWQIHFNLTRQINPLLSNEGYYRASPAYRAVLQVGGTASPATFVPMLRDALSYSWYVDRTKPPLDLCKAEENGSPFYLWPIGARAINYRWETSDRVHYRYLYLQSNPAVWAIGLLGLVGAALLIARSLASSSRPLKRPGVLMIVAAMYVGYFVPFAWIHGVMYLYHYFLPLMLTFVMCALVLDELPFDRRVKSGIAAAALALIVACFWFYKPLTYYEPLSDTGLRHRAWVKVWDLRCARCARGAGLAGPCGAP